MHALAAHIDIPPKLLGSLIVLGLVLIVWAIVAIAKSGSKPPMQMAPGGPPCNTCGGPARWNYNGWVCDRCQRQVIPMGAMPPQAPMGYQQPPYGQPNMAQPGMPPQHMQQQPPMAVAHQGPTCPTCQGPGRWLPESNAWGCDRCRQLIGPAAQA